MNKTLTGIVAGIVILLGVIWFARPDSPDVFRGAMSAASGALAAVGSDTYDFGTLSMKNGVARYSFALRNTSAAPVTVRKMYTSCMCTTATLVVGTTRLGPVGMPGHGAIPSLDQVIGPNEEASVEVVFDPAAHGPAGVGRIQRSITLEQDSGAPLELQFSAMVTP